MRNNPACPIADIFVLTGDIGGRGWGAGARGEGASGCRGPREVGRRGEAGEDESEGWSGGSNNASDAETEEEGWGHAPLTASPWGTQASRARGLRVDERAGGSDGRKAPSTMADEAGTPGRHGAGKEQGVKKGGRRG